jgi:hypothetical protein
VPVRSMEFMQREYDKFYNTDVSKANHKLTKAILKQKLLEILDEENMMMLVVGDKPEEEPPDIHTTKNYKEIGFVKDYEHSVIYT